MSSNLSLVVGGSNGIGLAIALHLAKTGNVIVVDKSPVNPLYYNDNIKFEQFDLLSDDFSIFDKFENVRNLIITAGFGRLALFEDLSENEIVSQIKVNSIAPIRIIKHFYGKLNSAEDFNCAVMVSIAGFMSSPFFSTYGASKAALKIFIESVNVELSKNGIGNRILNVSPGSIKGTKFNNGENDIALTMPLAEQIIDRMRRKEDLWIPQYDEVFCEVLKRYHDDFRAEGLHSYDYKLKSGRIGK